MFNKYPYTDFHELNLDWFLNQFKELVSDWEDFHATVSAEWAAVQQEWTDTETAWQTLYNYVHDYFDNLDVQEEIDHKLDEMVADGTMQQLLVGSLGDCNILFLPGTTIEDKLIYFLDHASNGDKLNLMGYTINITQRYTKTIYTFLDNCIISNGKIVIPASIGGWLSVDQAGGYRVPTFNDCTFSGGGAIFYNTSYNFRAVGCTFYDVQLIADGYVQAAEFVGCTIMNRNDYFIKAKNVIGLLMTDCNLEAGNVGIFEATTDSSTGYRASLTDVSLINTSIEGFTNTVFKTYGITGMSMINCYVENVPYLINDSNTYTDQCLVTISGGLFDNRNSANTYTIISTASYPALMVDHLNFPVTGSNHRLSNLPNLRNSLADSNTPSTSIYAADARNWSKTINRSGTSFSFTTPKENQRSTPQAFIAILQIQSNTPVMHQRAVLLNVAYRPSTDFVITETELFKDNNFTANVSWSISGHTTSDLIEPLTITCTSDTNIYASIINLGSIMTAF